MHKQTKKIEEIEVVTKKLEPEASATSNADDAIVNTVGWAGAHYQMLQSLDMRDEILLDTASTHRVRVYLATKTMLQASKNPTES
jgi:hypothetical protein